MNDGTTPLGTGALACDSASPDETRELVVGLAQDGRNVKDIAAQLHIGKARVSRMLHDANAPTLPDDAIREREAVAIMSGRPEQGGSGRYGRLAQRLAAAATNGEITVYRRPGLKSRYSRREIEALRDRDAAEGRGPRPMTPRVAHTALRTRMAARGLVATGTVSQRFGIAQSTVTGWGRKRLYGAQKIAGEWWFEEQLLPDAPPHRAHQPPQPVQCPNCGTWHERPAWEVRQGGQHYCDLCWPDVAENVTRDNLNLGRDSRWPVTGEAAAKMSANMSAAQKRVWSAASEERRARLHAACAAGFQRLLSSPKRRLEWRRKTAPKLLGRALTQLEEDRIAASARRLVQTSTDRSADDLRSWVTELWAGPLTAEEIGQELARRRGGGKPFTARYVRKLAREARLPRRPRGRPRKIGTT